MKLKTSLFCSLSRHPHMQLWLSKNAKDLYTALMGKLNDGAGCSAARDLMMDIYRELRRRGKLQVFEAFLKERFPYVIEPIKPTAQVKAELSADANKHDVFQRYTPKLFRFPRQLIIVDADQNQLTAKVNRFIRDKLGVDYLVIEDRAYIEYFLPQHAAAAAQIPKESREISLYRRRHNIKDKVKAN